jgi:hypothetical protein
MIRGALGFTGVAIEFRSMGCAAAAPAMPFPRAMDDNAVSPWTLAKRVDALDSEVVFVAGFVTRSSETS